MDIRDFLKEKILLTPRHVNSNNKLIGRKKVREVGRGHPKGDASPNGISRRK